MFEWLKRRISPQRARRSNEELLASIDAALGDAQWGQRSIVNVCRALNELGSQGAAAMEEHRPLLRERMDRWFACHPFEVKWGRNYEFTVVDPLGITTEETIESSENAYLAPWATILRSFEVVTGGANIFQHGCDTRALIDLLRDPFLPTRIENLPLPFLVDESPADVDELIDLLCSSDALEGLRHLAFSQGLTLGTRHFERLARAPWARSLVTLDLTEMMVDWSVDREADLHRVLPTLGGFESLTHLFMINNVYSGQDVAALLEASFPKLTHLNLGCIGEEIDALEQLATTESFPNLEELCLSSGPNRTSAGWDRIVEAPFSVYLHGTLVTDEYPKRTA